MNAVEIEEAVSALAGEPFDPGEFPFAFPEAFGNKQTTIKRLRVGTTNRSDVGGVLQRSNIHIKVAPEGEAAAALAALKAGLPARDCCLGATRWGGDRSAQTHLSPNPQQALGLPGRSPSLPTYVRHGARKELE